MADIVDDFLTRLKTLAPEIPAEVTGPLEASMRQQWGGTEPYVGKRPSRLHSLAIGNALQQRQPIDQAFVMAGVSRRHGYRLLNRK